MNEMNAVQIDATKDMHRRGVRLSTESIDYLIEQAERAQGLENRIQNKILPEIEKGYEQNMRFREALEFYANAETYETNVVKQWDPVIPIYRDSGKIARLALEAERRD